MTLAVIPKAVIFGSAPQMVALALARRSAVTAPAFKKFMSTSALKTAPNQTYNRSYSGFRAFMEREKAEEAVFIHKYESAHIREFKADLAKIKQQIRDLEGRIEDYKKMKRLN